MIINPYRFAAGGITDPTDIAGLDLWLDASDNSTVLDSADTAAADDGLVKTWQDKSGNANHAVQTVAAPRPARRAAEINGLDVLDFDGFNDRLNGTSDLTQRQTDEKTIFVVSLLGNTAAQSPFSPYDTSTLGARGSLFSSTVINTGYAIAGGLWGSSDDIQDATNAGLMTFTQSSTGDLHAAVGMRLDGVDLVRDAGTDRAFTDAAAGYTVGGWTSGSQWFDGNICEIIVYNTELSAGDIGDVETYLADKWGITI